MERTGMDKALRVLAWVLGAGLLAYLLVTVLMDI